MAALKAPKALKILWMIAWTLLLPQPLKAEPLSGDMSGTKALEGWALDLKNSAVLRVASGNSSAVKNPEVTVLQFWASWCMSCSTLIPLVHKTLEAKAPHARMITVSADEDVLDARGYLRKHAALFETLDLMAVLDNDGKLAKAFKLKGVPATVVLVQGQEPKVFYGFEETSLVQHLARTH